MNASLALTPPISSINIVELFKFLITVAMPSVGMRRIRVFGLRSVDGCRVLSSGRRVCADFIRGKFKKSNDVIDWYPVVDNEVRHVKRKRVVVVDIREDGDDDNVDDCVAEVPGRPVKVARINGDGESCDVDRMFGKVYSRKRKRDLSSSSDASDEIDGDDVMLGNRKFALCFTRRQRLKNIDVEHCERSTKLQFLGRRILPPCPLSQDSVLTMFSGSNHAGGRFSDVMLSVLRHVKNPKLGVAKVYTFLQSNPIHEVFSSKGMSFLQSYPPTRSSGVCVIFGAIQSISMFHLDFSAVPLSFMYLHSKIFLRATWIETCLVYNRHVYMSSDNEEGSVEEQKCISGPGRISLDSEGMPFGLEHSKTRPLRASSLGIQTMQFRNGFSSCGARKKRSLRRMIRPRSLAAIQKAFGSFTADDTKGYVTLRSAASCNRHYNLAPRESAGCIKEAHSVGWRSAMDVDSSSCKVNILIFESDKCLREEGADIVLEFSASSDWHLVVKKGGSTRYMYKAENFMKPSSCNRFTRAILWSSDNGWKLEFPNRRDWFSFKDLYNECSDRNATCSTAKTIPVPSVSEVLDYVDSSGAFFQRPDTYISINDDEVCRAMAKTTANYDMDSDDEEWLSKFNNELIATDKLPECISLDTFESMIDAFEKESFYGLDSDEKAPADICLRLGSSPVVESLFTYWMKKRRQRKSSLISVFRAHQVKKKPWVIPKPIVRRRRSLKRHPPPIQLGSGSDATQYSILEATESRQYDVVDQNAIAIESRQDDVVDQNAMLKYEEAKAAADKCIENAVSKRRRAQVLLKTADVAACKATIALRIAETIRASELSEAEAAACFLAEIHS